MAISSGAVAVEVADQGNRIRRTERARLLDRDPIAVAIDERPDAELPRRAIEAPILDAGRGVLDEPAALFIATGNPPLMTVRCQVTSYSSSAVSGLRPSKYAPNVATFANLAEILGGR